MIGLFVTVMCGAAYILSGSSVFLILAATGVVVVIYEYMRRDIKEQ